MKAWLFAVFSFVFCFFPQARAQEATPLYTAPTIIDGSACTQEVFDRHKNRSWMMANREIEMAQSFILRPDSVLEYSCFETLTSRMQREGFVYPITLRERMGGLMIDTDRRFTDPGDEWVDAARASGYWWDVNNGIDLYIPNERRILTWGKSRGVFDFSDVGNPNENCDNGTDYCADPDNALSEMWYGGFDAMVGNEHPYDNLLERPMLMYLSRNFEHNYAGGLMDDTWQIAQCGAMSAVWEFVKCANYNAATFLDFDLYDRGSRTTDPISYSDVTRQWQANALNSNDLRLQTQAVYGFNCNVEWGENDASGDPLQSIVTNTVNASERRHQYTAAGTYSVRLSGQCPDFYVFNVTTTRANENYDLPISGGPYDCMVDWGDGPPREQIDATTGVRLSHTYANPGTYQIYMTGRCPGYGNYQDIDPRIAPSACNPSNSRPARSGRDANAIARRRLWDNAIGSTYPDPSDPYAVNGRMASARSYYQLFDPANCATTMPIWTGSTFQATNRTGVTQGFPYAVCIAPGCFYDYTANNYAGGCVNAYAAPTNP